MKHPVYLHCVKIGSVLSLKHIKEDSQEMISHVENGLRAYFQGNKPSGLDALHLIQEIDKINGKGFTASLYKN